MINRYTISKSQLLDKLRIFLVTIFLVMFSDTIWVRYTSINRISVTIYVGIVVAFLCINKSKKREFIILFIACFCIIASMLFNLDIDTLILYKIAILTIVWFVCRKFNPDEIMNCFVSFMIFLALFSLVALLFRDYIGGMEFIPTIDKGSYGTKMLIFTAFKLGSNNLFFFRNQGAFWEPGVFQAYLNFALALCLFKLNRRHKYFEILVFVITIITTMSTTGFIILFILIIIYLLRANSSSALTKLMVVFFIIIIGGILINNDEINYLLFDKLSLESDNYISTATRQNSVFANLNGIINSPMFGLGVKKYATLFNSSNSAFGNVSVGVNTTTSLSVWALYGVVYFVIFNLGIYGVCKYFNLNGVSKVLLLFCMFIIYNTENYNYSLFYNYLVMLGIMFLFCRDINDGGKVDEQNSNYFNHIQ